MENVYKGKVLNVVDGDTFDALVELGFGVVQKFRVRLLGVDTPEKNTEEGVRSWDAVKDLIDGKTVYLSDNGKGKYGRALARVELSNGQDLTEWIIDHDLGKPYKGGKRRLCTIDLV